MLRYIESSIALHCISRQLFQSTINIRLISLNKTLIGRQHLIFDFNVPIIYIILYIVETEGILSVNAYPHGVATATLPAK